MSYSMSPPPPQKQPPRPYSPYAQQAGSPIQQSPYGPPPAKRQRMSPVSPQNGPNGAASGWAPPPHGLPHQHSGYGNPYAPHSAVQSPYGGGTPTYAHSPQHSSFNTPQPYNYQPSPWSSQPPTPAPQQQRPMHSPPAQQSREMMPPPPRPAREDREEKVGVEEIGDSLFGSGINLKDEENYMHNVYHNRHTQETSFGSTNQGSSFGSSTMTMSPNNSFNLLTQGTSFAGQSQHQTQQSQDGGVVNGAFAGTLGQPQTEEEIELEQRRKREVAAREQAERRQHHLNNQFLQCNNVRKKMDNIARNFHVSIDIRGVFVRQPDPESATTPQQPRPQTNVMVNGAGTEGIVATKQESRPESMVNQNTPFESMVSLISLAAGERIRGLLDEAFTLSRARRFGDHGRVLPVDFRDVAEGVGRRDGEEEAPGEGVSGGPWDAVAGEGEGEKDGAGEDGKEATPAPQSTISFAGALNASLRSLVERDRQAEKLRLEKREARRRKATAAIEDPSSSTPPAEAAAPESGTTAAPDQPAPKMTKKELARQQKAKNSSTEAAMTTSTNQTAAMMALGKKGSRYSWMTGGASAMPTNRFAKPGASGSGTNTPTAGGGSGGASAAVTPGGVGGTGMVKAGSSQGVEGKGKEEGVKWGDWTEDATREIEMRDWALVLERDGREGKALVKAMVRGEVV